jgi:8-oxo-dGTP pyrophosphatase MutT (NUDIX family)
VTHYNREEVDRRLARIRDQYDPFFEHENVELTPEGFEGLAEQAADGYTGGGYAWVVREEPPPLSESMPEVDEAYPRVLLALGRDDDGWGPAGGGREGDEDFEEAAVREVCEETGVECTIEDCRRVRRTTFEPAEPVDGDGESVVYTLWVFFTAREVGGSIDVQESELNGAAWFHDLPADLHWSVEGHPWSWAEW